MRLRTLPLRRRQRLLASLLGLGLACASPAAMAATDLVFVTGAFRRSIPVADLEHLATTGEARGLLGDVLKLSGQDPRQASTLLQASVSLPVALVSRLIHTRIGEALLLRLARVLRPLKAPEMGLPAMRSAIVLGIVNGNGSLTPISFLRAYPNDEIEVNLPQLMALISRASSITELIRFFTESPLDGLRDPATDEEPRRSLPEPTP